jgi:hypothetical protein
MVVVQIQRKMRFEAGQCAELRIYRPARALPINGEMPSSAFNFIAYL